MRLSLLRKFPAATTAAVLLGVAVSAAWAAPADTASSVPETLRYVSPWKGSTAPTRVGGGARGVSGKIVSISVLAPDHVATTVYPRPVLFWFTSGTITDKTEITITARGDLEPLLELRMVPPLSGGIHALDLEKLGIALKPAKEYQWFVAVIKDPDQRSQDIVTGGEIQRVEAPDELRRRLEAVSAGDRPKVYAEAGLWYDAVQSISDLIKANPDDAVLRAQRIDLLKQVGLDEAAAHDRGIGQ